MSRRVLIAAFCATFLPALQGRPVRLFDAIGAAALTRASPAGATIRGHVDTPPPSAGVPPRPPVEDVMPGAEQIIDQRRSVVYLAEAPRAAFDDRYDQHARMDQRGQTFVPHVLAITAGTVVDFPNNDRTYHNVFSLSKPKPFDLGRYAVGRSKSVRFERAGIVRVFCDIHSHMSAYILVFAHRYFAVTDANGNYQLENVPPGTYTLVAWNEAFADESRQVTVGDSGTDVEANFTFAKK